jgi:hypothetical protein
MIRESFSGSYGSSPPGGNRGSSLRDCDGGGGGGEGGLKLGSVGKGSLEFGGGLKGGGFGEGGLGVGDGVFGGGGAVGAGEGGRGE